jgi:FkbM family methyltransferase
MPLKELKKMVKASPFLYERLFPIVMSARRARKRAIDKKRDKAIARFRNFCQKLTKAVASPVFVKVGANDGIGDDPCSDIFLANANWSGLLIEPVPFWFERLKANFKGEARFRFEQLAVGSPAGHATFYYVDPKGRERMPNWEDWFDKLGSFDRNHILKHAGGILAPFIIETQVPVCPLTEVLARNQIQEVHLLHVDAEGYDYEVLKTLDFSKVTPLAIFIEHFHLPAAQKKEMVKFLIQRGYDVHDCISDYFAVNREAAHRWLRNVAGQTK